MSRDLDFTFKSSSERYAKLLADRANVAIVRRTSSAGGRVHTCLHEGIVTSVRISEGCIYISVCDHEFCVYDTSDAYASTIISVRHPQVPSVIGYNMFGNCIRCPIK